MDHSNLSDASKGVTVIRLTSGLGPDKSAHDMRETARMSGVERINLVPGSRESLEAKYGQVWDTDELQCDYSPLGFAAPYIIVRRKSDSMKGTLTFQHNPRFYFDFQPTT